MLDRANAPWMAPVILPGQPTTGRRLAYANRVGVLLCKEKDDEIVEIALSRSLSPTMIATYETHLIDKALLRNKLHEFYEVSLLGEGEA